MPRTRLKKTSVETVGFEEATESCVTRNKFFAVKTSSEMSVPFPELPPKRLQKVDLTQLRMQRALSRRTSNVSSQETVRKLSLIEDAWTGMKKEHSASQLQGDRLTSLTQTASSLLKVIQQLPQRSSIKKTSLPKKQENHKLLRLIQVSAAAVVRKRTSGP